MIPIFLVLGLMMYDNSGTLVHTIPASEMEDPSGQVVSFDSYYAIKTTTASKSSSEQSYTIEEWWKRGVGYRSEHTMMGSTFVYLGLSSEIVVFGPKFKNRDMQGRILCKVQNPVSAFHLHPEAFVNHPKLKYSPNSLSPDLLASLSNPPNKAANNEEQMSPTNYGRYISLIEDIKYDDKGRMVYLKSRARDHNEMELHEDELRVEYDLDIPSLFFEKPRGIQWIDDTVPESKINRGKTYIKETPMSEQDFNYCCHVMKPPCNKQPFPHLRFYVQKEEHQVHQTPSSVTTDWPVHKRKGENQPLIRPEQLTRITAKDGAEMLLIPAGDFLMGSPESEGDKDEYPQHKVHLDAFYIDRYDVTNEQYAKFLNSYGRDADDNDNKMFYESRWGVKKVNGKWQPASGYEKYPVVFVTWYGANQYAKYYGKRLPTEAEWENAARAGSDTKYYFGGDDSYLEDYAWYKKNSESKTYPVGMKKPNAWGLYDMHGNVWQWCADRYDENYYKERPFIINPKGAEKGAYRVLRGGSGIDTVYCRSASRGGSYAIFANCGWGFRCALSANAQ